jgi:hypothetical protein
MPTLSADLRKTMVAAVEAEFGEAVLYTPMGKTSEYFQGQPDFSPFSAVAVVRLETSITERHGRDLAASTRLMASNATATIDRDQMSSTMPKPRKGDRLQLVDRDASPVFVIDIVEEDGKGRFVCELQKL